MKKILFSLFFTFLLFSCSNKTDVKIVGLNLDSPCLELVKQIENTGFKADGKYLQEEITSDEDVTLNFTGEYLGEEDVKLSLSNKKNGHYTSGMLIKMFTNDNDMAKHFYRKICKAIKKEHSGFEEERSSSDLVEYYNEDGGNIKVSLTTEYSPSLSLGCVMVLYKTGKNK